MELQKQDGQKHLIVKELLEDNFSKSDFFLAYSFFHSK